MKIIVNSKVPHIPNALPSLKTEDKTGKECVNPFKDVFRSKDNQISPWYLEAVCYAKLHYWIDGYADNNVRPDESINFAEAAKIITNATVLNPLGVTPSEPWYEVYVSALAEKNAIPLTITKLNQTLTRGEMAEIIFRVKSEKTNLPSQNYLNLQSQNS